MDYLHSSAYVRTQIVRQRKGKRSGLYHIVLELTGGEEEIDDVGETGALDENNHIHYYSKTKLPKDGEYIAHVGNKNIEDAFRNSEQSNAVVVELFQKISQ